MNYGKMEKIQSVNKLICLLRILFNVRLVGYEGLEVINPEGSTEDAEAEAHKGRWKQEVLLSNSYFVFYLQIVADHFGKKLFEYLLLYLPQSILVVIHYFIFLF